MKKIKRVLISLFDKSKILKSIDVFKKYNIEIISTGGTKDFLVKNGCEVKSIEEITTYPSILGGRVKTLHPKIFGGLLYRSDNLDDIADLQKFDIVSIDMLVVDLYPFEETIKTTSDENKIIEKIDIGGVSLIRASAKNYKNVFVVSSMDSLDKAISIIDIKNGYTDINDRILFAKKAFRTTSHYEMLISNYFNEQAEPINESVEGLVNLFQSSKKLRYGENPHQKAEFFGNLNEAVEQLSGKELSYNNLLDVDAAINLINEFKETSFGIIKHNNACGFASDKSLLKAWNKALAGDPISAFGGVLVTNSNLDKDVCNEIDKLFFEIIIAPSYDKTALEILKRKKNRIILMKKNTNLQKDMYKTVLNGILFQERDFITDGETLVNVSQKKPSKKQMEDLLFASKICKHTKSNAIVLASDKQLIGSGCGQTSRVDALKHAISKANQFDLDLNNSVMASDAFFPFPDCVEIASKSGVSAVIQPGGSKNDNLSIDFCDKNNLTMVFTKTRHFKH